MAKKIEGWVGDTTEQWLKDNFNGGAIFRKTQGVGELASTLVIHDGPSERVFTASEVAEMLKDMVFFADHISGTRYVEVETMVIEAEKHGITL